MRTSRVVGAVCLSHRGYCIFLTMIAFPYKFYFCKDSFPNIKRFLDKYLVKFDGDFFLRKEYEVYLMALLAGASLSSVLRRMREDGVL